MNWQKMQWPLPPEMVPKDRQDALYFYPYNDPELPGGAIIRMYWDASISDFRFAEDVAHIYGGKEPAYIMLIELPEAEQR